MKRIAQYLPAAFIAVTALGLTTACSKHKTTGDEQLLSVDVALPRVDSVTLHKSYPGFLKAYSTVDVVGRVNGTLNTVNYDGGNNVTAGQVLFTIDSKSYRDALQKAEAALATARSQYDYASKEYQAMKKALESDAVSRMEVVQAESNMKNAQAAISEAAAALNTARSNLSYCTVRAPISGTITTNNYSAGNYISGEGSPVVLATIYDNKTLRAVFQVDDTQYIKITGSKDQTQIKDDFTHIPLIFEEKLPHSYTASLSYTAPAIDESTGTITFEANVQNPYGELRNGMFVKINMPYAFDKEAILINDASIMTDQRGKYIYTVNDSDKVVYTPVTVGELINDTLRVVTSGLKPDTRYVTKALLKVRDGMKVKPVMTR